MSFQQSLDCVFSGQGRTAELAPNLSINRGNGVRQRANSSGVLSRFIWAPSRGFRPRVWWSKGTWFLGGGFLCLPPFFAPNVEPFLQVCVKKKKLFWFNVALRSVSDWYQMHLGTSCAKHRRLQLLMLSELSFILHRCRFTHPHSGPGFSPDSI